MASASRGSTAVAGGTTRVQLHAIAGLASSHTSPFLRLIHEDIIARRHRPREDATKVARELPEDHAAPTHLQRSHHRRSEYTAEWPCDDVACEAILPIDADWIELQVWNRFTDVAVFLGTTSISLRALQRRNATSEENGNNDDDEGRRFIPAAVPAAGARAVWYPLEPSKQTSGLSRSSLSHLSVQVSISFHRYDARTQRIHQQITERRQEKTSRERERDGDPKLPTSSTVVVDPSFQFTEPCTRIEWSSIVAANVKRMFHQGNVEELLVFFSDVVHGDLEQEIEEDDEIVVSDAHVKAFRLSQLSAQYVDHCVSLLATRQDEYEDHYRVLRATRRDRRREQRQLLDQKKRLRKELDELELLTTTYEKLLGHHTAEHVGVDDRWSERESNRHSCGPSPIRESSDVVSKKPTFLMTWEEREQVRKQQKELDKARRIDDEKLRLEKRFQERQERQRMELGFTSLAQRRRERSARALQRVVRSFLKKRAVERSRRLERAVVLIQTHTRRLLCVKKWPRARQKLRQYHEQRQMERCDREAATIRQQARGLLGLQQQQTQHRVQVDQDANLFSSEDELGDPVRAMDLVATWKKLKRIFTLACRQGARSDSVFARLDSHADGIVDRAEFRVGVRYFGIRIDRKMTRAVIALVRAKCGDLAIPLSLTLSQFVCGFDLPLVVEPREPQKRTIDSSPPSSSSKGTAQSRTPARVGSSGANSPEPRVDQDEQDAQEEDGQEEDEEEDVTTSAAIEQVAHAVSSLRRRVLEAASDHLNAHNKSASDYAAFRAALTHVFEEFDVDGNGELDLQELVACMAAINFRVTRENVAMLRECFVSDPTLSDTVSISEFISFALAGLPSSSSSSPSFSARASSRKQPADEELGILGFKLRDAILGRVKLARKQTDSIEDAVRLVFKRAYKTKRQTSCARQDFVRVLASLRLGFTPAQLSRLVLRLDQDGDNTISFGELMLWLRLTVRDKTSAGSSPPPSTPVAVDRRTLAPTSSGAPDTVASLLRKILSELAGLDEQHLTNRQRTDRVAALFRRIDDNDSTKIHASELESFFSSANVAELRSIMDCEDPLVSSPSRLAEQTVKLLDLNGNGVVTLEEWTGFIVGASATTQARGEQYAVVEGIRHAMRAAFSDESSLLAWLRSIPGAMASNKTSTSDSEMKVRTREFKTAIRAKFPFISTRDVDCAMKLLDADGSGWITEKELSTWQFPTRDVEELRAVITRAWSRECDSVRLRALPTEVVVDALYQRFDRDGNGLIARKEVRDGFLCFHVALTDDETLRVIQEFDTDNDGFWNKSEFAACVRQLVPALAARVEIKPAELPPVASESRYSSDSGQDGYDSPDLDKEEGDLRDEASDGERYREEDSENYSLGELSPLAMSPIQFNHEALAAARGSRHAATTGVEYSEDFDEDA